MLTPTMGGIFPPQQVVVKHIRPDEVSNDSSPQRQQGMIMATYGQGHPSHTQLSFELKPEPMGPGSVQHPQVAPYMEKYPLRKDSPVETLGAGHASPREYREEVNNHLDRLNAASSTPSRAASMQAYPLQQVPLAHTGIGGNPYAYGHPMPSLVPMSQSALSAIKIEQRSLPKFQPNEGLVPFLKYFRRWTAVFQLYSHLLCGNTPLQHQLLMTSLAESAQAMQFINAHMDEIIDLCEDPLAAPLLRTAAQNQTAVASARAFSTLERVLKMNAMGQGHLLAQHRQVPPAPSASRRTETSLPLHTAGAIQELFGPPENVPEVNEKFALIWAWMVVVEKYCCKPQPHELKVWEHNMQMGVSNIFDTVPATETPTEFLHRIIDTYEAYNKFAKAQIDQIVKHGPVDVYCNGIPSELKEDAKNALKKIGVDRSTTTQQLYAVGEAVQKAFEYNTLVASKRAVESGEVHPKKEPPKLSYDRTHDTQDSYSRQRYDKVDTAAAVQGLQWPASMHPRGNKSSEQQGSRPDRPDNGRQYGHHPDRGRQQPHSGGGGSARQASGGEKQAANTGGPSGSSRPKTCMLCRDGLGLKTTDHLAYECPYKDFAIAAVQKGKEDGSLETPPRPTTVVHAPTPSPAPQQWDGQGRGRGMASPSDRSVPPAPRPSAASGVISGDRPPVTSKNRVSFDFPIVYDEEEGDDAPPNLVSSASILLGGLMDHGPAYAESEFHEARATLSKLNEGNCYLLSANSVGSLGSPHRISGASGTNTARPEHRISGASGTNTARPEPTNGGSESPRGGVLTGRRRVSYLLPIVDDEEEGDDAPSNLVASASVLLGGLMDSVQDDAEADHFPMRNMALRPLAEVDHFPMRKMALRPLAPMRNVALGPSQYHSLAAAVTPCPGDDRGFYPHQALEARIQRMESQFGALVSSQASMQSVFLELGAKFDQFMASQLTQPSTVAGAVAESFVKDPKKVFPESFVPKGVADVLGEKKQIDTGTKRGSEAPAPAPLPVEVSSPQVSSVVPVLDQTDMSKLQTVKTSAIPSDVVISKTRRPLSFEVIEQQIEPWMIISDISEKRDLSNPVATLLAVDALSSSVPQVDHCDLIDEYIHNLPGRLSYFAPDAQVGISYEGVKSSDPSIMLDLGSNVCLIDDKWCHEHNIPVYETSLSLNTSNAVSTSLVGITPPLAVCYGPPSHEVRTYHAFLVVRYRKKAPFRALIGNCDVMRFHGIQDLGTQTVSFRTEWDTKGVNSPLVTFPILARRP